MPFRQIDNPEARCIFCHGVISAHSWKAKKHVLKCCNTPIMNTKVVYNMRKFAKAVIAKIDLGYH